MVHCKWARAAVRGGRFASIAVLATACLAASASHQDDVAGALPPGPSFEQVLSLEEAGSPAIAPDGSALAYTVRSADWEKNRYETEIWLARAGEEPFQLTRTKSESSTSPAWSPDGEWIAFRADRGDGIQIHLIRSRGGEALQLTNVKDISSFEWSPDGERMAVTITDPEDDEDEARKKRYGEYAVEDAEYRMTHLWVLDVARAMEEAGGAKLPDEKKGAEDEADADEQESEGEANDDEPPAFRRLTGGEDFTVGSCAWSPDGRWIALDHRPDPLINSRPETDLSKVDVASGEITPLVERAGYDGDPIWSPDGEWVLFATSDGETAFYLNNELAKVPAAGGEATLLTASFDENPRAVDWLGGGIRFLAFQKTRRSLFGLDPESGAVEPIPSGPRFIGSVDYSKDGRHVALSAADEDTLTEIYLGPATAPERITDMTAQTAGWPLGTREVIEWKSEDGATIEGVLFKPKDFDPGARHPLFVVIHGGPAGISLPSLVAGGVYPVEQWLARGALVMMPNYRGSTGYGEAFRSLNVRNLGVGDAWDVLSGVDSLIERGIVDEGRMGAMGWSQGGYISAFLTTTTGRFKAISVGAGISNWMTYYVNTDIHPFTRHYLQATPWDDPEVYAKTSPMTYIKDATTPTLIQHGELDRRVPIANAYELFQGLQDVGVEAKLVVYKGFGHGISKPKERLAATWHNWQWFAKHVFGEEVEIPLE